MTFSTAALPAYYTTPAITVNPYVDTRSGIIICTLNVATSGSPTVAIVQVSMETTKAAVDAKIGSVLLTGDTAKFLNALDQVVKDWLLVLNPSVTFTIV